MRINRNRSYRKYWDKLIELHGRLCFYCQIEEATQIDHVVPYSWDQDNSLNNIVPSCGVCNRLAGDKMFDDVWHKRAYIIDRRKMRGYRLPERPNEKPIDGTCNIPPNDNQNTPVSDLTGQQGQQSPRVEDYIDKIIEMRRYDDIVEYLKQIYNEEKITYRDLRDGLDINQYYMWNIINTPDYDPPNWVYRKLKAVKNPRPPRIAIRKDDAESAARSIVNNVAPDTAREIAKLVMEEVENVCTSKCDTNGGS